MKKESRSLGTTAPIFQVVIVSIMLSLCSAYPLRAQFPDDALTFDGVDDYAQVGDSDALSTPDAFTWEAWVYITKDEWGINEEFATVFAKVWANDEYWFAIHADGRIHIRFAKGDFKSYSDLTKPVDFGRWQHLAVTWDGTTVKAYVNGDAQTLGTYEGSIPNTPSGMLIGATVTTWPPRYHFKGHLAEVSIWGRALGAKDIAGRAKGARVLPGAATLRVYWPMYPDADPTVAVDIIGDNHAALRGPVRWSAPDHVVAAFSNPCTEPCIEKKMLVLKSGSEVVYDANTGKKLSGPTPAPEEPAQIIAAVRDISDAYTFRFFGDGTTDTYVNTSPYAQASSPTTRWVREGLGVLNDVNKEREIASRISAVFRNTTDGKVYVVLTDGRYLRATQLGIDLELSIDDGWPGLGPYRTRIRAALYSESPFPTVYFFLNDGSAITYSVSEYVNGIVQYFQEGDTRDFVGTWPDLRPVEVTAAHARNSLFNDVFMSDGRVETYRVSSGNRYPPGSIYRRRAGPPSDPAQIVASWYMWIPFASYHAYLMEDGRILKESLGRAKCSLDTDPEATPCEHLTDLFPGFPPEAVPLVTAVLDRQLGDDKSYIYFFLSDKTYIRYTLDFKTEEEEWIPHNSYRKSLSLWGGLDEYDGTISAATSWSKECERATFFLDDGTLIHYSFVANVEWGLEANHIIGKLANRKSFLGLWPDYLGTDCPE